MGDPRNAAEELMPKATNEGLLYGYGRGWSEPRAVGWWARLKQFGREPATEEACWTALGGIVFLFSVAMALMLYPA